MCQFFCHLNISRNLKRSFPQNIFRKVSSQLIYRYRQFVSADCLYYLCFSIWKVIWIQTFMDPHSFYSRNQIGVNFSPGSGSAFRMRIWIQVPVPVRNMTGIYIKSLQNLTFSLLSPFLNWHDLVRLFCRLCRPRINV